MPRACSRGGHGRPPGREHGGRGRARCGISDRVARRSGRDLGELRAGVRHHHEERRERSEQRRARPRRQLHRRWSRRPAGARGPVPRRRNARSELRLRRSGVGGTRHRRRLRGGRPPDGRQRRRGRVAHVGGRGRLARRPDDRPRRGRPAVPQRWHLHQGLRRHGPTGGRAGPAERLDRRRRHDGDAGRRRPPDPDGWLGPHVPWRRQRSRPAVDRRGAGASSPTARS